MESKIILITGASTGIGYGIAKAFSEKGHKVFAGVRKEEDAVKLQETTQATPIFLDVTKSEEIEKAKKQITNLDILINNAGIAEGGPIEGLSLEVFRKIFEVNFFGLIEVTQKFLPLIRESKGRIINISSISGRLATPYFGPYTCSKFALEAFSDALRRETESQQIKVVSINPGAIKTPIWDKGISQTEINRDNIPEGIKPFYEDSMESLKGLVEENVANGASVDEVVSAVDKALFDDHPKTRYYVGKGIGFQAKLASFLPDKLMDKLVLKRFS